MASEIGFEFRNGQRVCPGDLQSVVSGTLELDLSAERRRTVSQADQRELIGYDRALEAALDSLHAQRRAVDLFVAGSTPLTGCLVVVLSGEQIQIPDLRDAWHEQLDRTRE